MQELAHGVLDPAGNELQLDSIVVRSPGISGEVTLMQPIRGETRSQSMDSDALGQALDHHEMQVDYVLEIGGLSEEPTQAAVTSRSMAPGQKGIEIQVPAAGDGFGQVLLVTDENGIASWQFPVTEQGGRDETRGGATVTFIVPGYVPAATDAGETRGLFGWLGKKVVRVLSFVIETVVGEVADYFAAKWEAKNRPYALRRMTRDTYRTNGAGELTAEDWQKLGEGRSLLFIHGTFSRAASAFYHLEPDFMDELNERYSDRVFAFDHKTLSEDPTDNARFFANAMPDGQVLDVDIVCHSRGGHVSRILAEEQGDLPLEGKSLTVNQVVFVASPNRGTVLADAEYMGDFVDAYTNILGVLPDNLITDVLDVVITAVKEIAVGALKGLEGLQSMDPDGQYITDYLNKGQSSTAQYRAIAANYEPTDPKLKPWVKDRLMDAVFKEDNDLVVPTRGVYEHNGDEMFPITEKLELTGEDDVHHGSFFANGKVVTQLDNWLPG